MRRSRCCARVHVTGAARGQWAGRCCQRHVACQSRLGVCSNQARRPPCVVRNAVVPKAGLRWARLQRRRFWVGAALASACAHAACVQPPHSVLSSAAPYPCQATSPLPKPPLACAPGGAAGRLATHLGCRAAAGDGPAGRSPAARRVGGAARRRRGQRLAPSSAGHVPLPAHFGRESCWSWWQVLGSFGVGGLALAVAALVTLRHACVHASSCTRWLLACRLASPSTIVMA